MTRSALGVLCLGALFGATAGGWLTQRFGLLAFARLSRDEPSRYEQGRLIAERMGCFSCHGADGRGGTINFIPEMDEVPSWSRGNFKSFVRSRDEVREWIVAGAPARMRSDPAEKARITKQLIQMPAYRHHVSGEALEALVDYVWATSTLAPLEEKSLVAEGREVATRYGCFGCHGSEGRRRAPNPGSFKGYIPAWDSKDYAELVQSETELHEWVLQGAPKRLAKNPAARFFLERQAIKMPAYEGKMTEPELNALAAYVKYVRGQ
jgi:mono/diheme cytochrome c family protein